MTPSSSEQRNLKLSDIFLVPLPMRLTCILDVTDPALPSATDRGGDLIEIPRTVTPSIGNASDYSGFSSCFFPASNCDSRDASRSKTTDSVKALKNQVYRQSPYCARLEMKDLTTSNAESRQGPYHIAGVWRGSALTGAWSSLIPHHRASLEVGKVGKFYN